MIRKLDVEIKAPQYVTITGISFAQVDSWFGHCRTDLKMDIIYPECDKTYPCIVWICGGGWMTMDRSAHLAYLSELARAGFVVASVDYRTCNAEQYPAQLQDIKAGIRYLRAHAKRYRIDDRFIGVTGESAGGHLAAMAALVNDSEFDVGDYTEYSSKVQAACPWYPPTDPKRFEYDTQIECAASPESLLYGSNVCLDYEGAEKIFPVRHVTKDAPPFLIIHGNSDNTVPYIHGKILHDELDKNGCDVTLLEIDGAEHADIRFFQEDIWQEMISFFKEKLC